LPPENGLKKGYKNRKKDEKRRKRTKKDENGESFALPILTQNGQIAPGGPKTQIRTPKSAFSEVPANGNLT